MQNTTITPLMCLNLKNPGKSISHPFSFNRFPDNNSERREIILA
jgi:hypothetical protein